MGNYADENMIPQMPERDEYSNDNDYIDYLTYYKAKRNISKRNKNIMITDDLLLDQPA